MKLKDIQKILVDGLENIEFTDPFIESRRILMEVLDVSMTYLILNEEQELNKEKEEEIIDILNRRKNGEPLQYILGHSEFYGLDILLKGKVLIPRPDTEVSLENILKRLKPGDRFLELGVGSGAVICSVAKNSNAKCFGVDISEDALECTRLNIENLNLKNVEVKYSDLFENVEGKYDIIYSNPPYIKSHEILNLQVEITDYEPRLALDGGEDGLDFYKKIISEYRDYLNEGGYLIFEIGHDQGEFFEKLGAEIIKDLNGLPRVVIMRW